MQLKNLSALFFGAFLLLDEARCAETPRKKLEKRLPEVQRVLLEYDSKASEIVKEGWRRKFFEVSRDLFDIDVIGGEVFDSLGDAGAGYRERFLSIFPNYIGRFYSYSLEGKKFSFAISKGAVEKIDTIVPVSISIPEKGGGTETYEVVFNFKQSEDGEWRVINISVVGAFLSVTSFIRAQFQGKIKKSSFEELLRDIKTKGFQTSDAKGVANAAPFSIYNFMAYYDVMENKGKKE